MNYRKFYDNQDIINECSIMSASLEDYPIIANMARFYAYDLSRWCAFISDNWNFPDTGLYESFDPKIYFEGKTRLSYLIRVGQELAGFILINKLGTLPNTDWNMGEFYITAKFQGTGLARYVAHWIWNKYTGKWEVAVIPENKPAVLFWEKAISLYTNNLYIKKVKEVDYDKYQPKRIIFTFDTMLNR